MSLVPLIVDLDRYFERELDSHADDDFGFVMHPLDIFQRPRHPSLAHRLYRQRFVPYERALRRFGGGSRNERVMAAPSISAKDGFQVSMDVGHFNPSELSVKVVNRDIVVEGKHDERPDEHGLIQRHFVRRYTLPKGYDPNEVTSAISSDGVLTLKAPPPPNAANKTKERIVQIQQTGPAHLSVKAPPAAEDNCTTAILENGSPKKKNK